jgi:hypothetical protein
MVPPRRSGSRGLVTSEARLFGELDEALSLPDALRAYRLDAYLVDDFVAGLGRVERGHGGRAVEEARAPSA